MTAFLLAMALVQANTVYQSMENSLRGQWDATAVWNLLGRTLARIDGDPGSILRNMGSTHSEYPHMVPGSVSLLLRQTDDYAEGPGQFVAIMGLCSLFGLAFTGLRRLRGPLVASISTGLLMATPAFCFIAADQYTETWLAGLNLAAVLFVARCIQREEGLSVDLLLGGFFLGLLPWTKQEGIPLALALFLSMLAFCLFVAPRFLYLRKTLVILLGAAPAILASTLFRISWARKEDRLLSVSQGWDYATDRDRWRPVWVAFRDEITTRGQVLGFNVPEDFNSQYQRWAAFWPALLVLALIWASRCGLMRRDTLFVALCLFAQVSAFAFVFVLVPFRRQFHIDVALYRSLIVIAPIALALIAALSKPSGDIAPVSAANEAKLKEVQTASL